MKSRRLQTYALRVCKGCTMGWWRWSFQIRFADLLGPNTYWLDLAVKHATRPTLVVQIQVQSALRSHPFEGVGFGSRNCPESIYTPWQVFGSFDDLGLLPQYGWYRLLFPFLEGPHVAPWNWYDLYLAFLPCLKAISSSFLPVCRCVQNSGLKFDTEYDWAKVPPYNGNDTRPLLVVWRPFCFHPC